MFESGHPVSAPTKPLLLHVFHSFESGGSQTRLIRLANHFSDSLRHAIIAINGDYSAMQQVASDVDVERIAAVGDGKTIFGRIREMACLLAVREPDYLVTHNWGTIEWALANHLLGSRRRKHVHIEDGFGPDEAGGQKTRRLVARRFALRGVDVVVPSLGLRMTASQSWKISESRLHYIPNGIDCARYRHAEDARAARSSRAGARRIGTVAALRPEKNISRLLEAFALVNREEPSELVIAGDGPEKARLQQLAARLGLRDRVRFLGHVSNPAAIYSDLDIFVLSSDTEQMPYAVLEAMAAGLAIAATSVGDIGNMVSEENGAFLASRNAEELAAQILKIVRDRDLANRLGEANRKKVRECYDQSRMYDAFAKLYGIQG